MSFPVKPVRETAGIYQSIQKWKSSERYFPQKAQNCIIRWAVSVLTGLWRFSGLHQTKFLGLLGAKGCIPNDKLELVVFPLARRVMNPTVKNKS